MIDWAGLWAALGRKHAAWQHERAIRDVLETRPLIPTDDRLVLFSMIGTAVLLPYLVAIKSLHHRLKRGRVVLLDDGTLTASDRSILRHHLGNPAILEIGSISTGHCPAGNCWERLFAILEMRSDDYVIQLDSDTVTLADMPEIVAAIDANRSFTLAGGVDEAAVGFQNADNLVAHFYPDGATSNHVQHLAEVAMPRAGHGLRYIRGCAGFAGFARSSSGPALVTEMSQAMESLIGNKWHEWGSEQVASNFVIANDPDPLQLPYDRYVNHWTEPLPPAPAFIHFIGTYRYARGTYAKASREAIAALKR